MIRFPVSCLFLCLLAPITQAGQNYNYSGVDFWGAQTSTKYGTDKIDSMAYGLNARYELQTLPVILGASAQQEVVNSDELAEGDSLSALSIGATFGLVFSVNNRVDILPAVSVTHAEITAKSGGSSEKALLTLGKLSLLGRFHLERGLWLSAGIARQWYDRDYIDPVSNFTIGADYQVNDSWALGVDHSWVNDVHGIDGLEVGGTRLFSRFFY